MEPFPQWMKELPEADTPFSELEGRLLAGPQGQAVFFRAEKDFEVPPHAHGAQWGIVVSGNLELTVEGETKAYGPGDTYSIGAGEVHGAWLGAGTAVIDVFQDPDRYGAKAG